MELGFTYFCIIIIIIIIVFVVVVVSSNSKHYRQPRAPWTVSDNMADVTWLFCSAIPS